MYDVDIFKRILGFRAHREPGFELAQAQLAAETVPGFTNVMNSLIGRLARPRLERHEAHFVALLHQTVVQQLRQERVRRLVGRQVGRDHADLHAATHWSRNSWKVEPTAPFSLK